MARRTQEFLLSLPNDHPIQITIRTYTLALSLSLGPALLSYLSSRKARSKGLNGLQSIIRRELGVTGFSFAITVAIGGGAALQATWSKIEEDRTDYTHLCGEYVGTRLQKLKTLLASMKPETKTFLINALSSSVAIVLMHWRRRSWQTRKAAIPWTIPISPPDKTAIGRSSATLDLTLLVLVRAFDALTQKVVFHRAGDEGEEARVRRRRITTKLDALAFWASSARIMWCFFYEPERWLCPPSMARPEVLKACDRLPRSYVGWITSLANIDSRLVGILRAIRNGEWSYIHGSRLQPDTFISMAQDLGYPASWGTAGLLPAYGGPAATAQWRSLGVPGRDGIGGLPCELVHGNVAGGSCTMNAAVRGVQAFLEAFAIYVPVHFLPILLTRPHSLLRLPKITSTLLGALRSAGFLSTFVSSIWAAVCLTRTGPLARLFPQISHDVYDGPFGCILAGCLACGSSIWIENGRRRGEMALYVMPRALRACLPDKWIRSGRSSVYALERLAFTLSLASLLTFVRHQPQCLRGLSRWTLSFIMNGPNAGMWRNSRPGSPAPLETRNAEHHEGAHNDSHCSKGTYDALGDGSP